MARENLDFNGIGNDIPSVRNALIALQQDFDSHIHDGTNSRVFQTLQAETVSARVFSVRKTSFTDTVAGLWTGLVGNIPKFYLGSATDYFKFDQNGLSLLLASGNLTINQNSLGNLVLSGTGIEFKVGSLINASIILSSGGNSLGSPAYPTTMRFTVGEGSGDSDAVQLDFNATASATGDLSPSNGSVNLGKTGSRYNTIYLVNTPDVSSDIRLKKKVRKSKYGLKEVLKMRPIQYKMGSLDAIGFSAQDLKKIVPEIVSKPKNKKEMYSVREMELIPVLVKAVQELEQKYRDLLTEHKALKKRSKV